MATEDPEIQERDKAVASALKAEGNALYKKGKFGAASEKYTEALTHAPKMVVLLVNRAQCHKKKGRWDLVEQDARKALELDGSLFKAHYLLGLALDRRCDVRGSVHHLTKALELGREQPARAKEPMWRSLAGMKYRLWEMEAAERTLERENLKGYLVELMHRAHSAELSTAGVVSEDALQQRLAALDRVFDAAANQDKPREAAPEYTCSLTMEPYREPVITPAGISYEGSSLEEHFEKVGRFDPVTRQAINPSACIPNKALRAATQSYLDAHPWAYREMMD
eukprot:jgi/Botrbrau1/13662/Bobra.0292s0011.1